jgi:hypothetical protein
MRELSAKPRAVLRQLHREGALVIAHHGQPCAIMFPVDESNFLDTAVDALAIQALGKLRAGAPRTGMVMISSKQIVTASEKPAKRGDAGHRPCPIKKSVLIA